MDQYWLNHKIGMQHQNTVFPEAVSVILWQFKLRVFENIWISVLVFAMVWRRAAAPLPPHANRFDVKVTESPPTRSFSPYPRFMATMCWIQIANFLVSAMVGNMARAFLFLYYFPFFKTLMAAKESSLSVSTNYKAPLQICRIKSAQNNVAKIRYL